MVPQQDIIRVGMLSCGHCFKLIDLGSGRTDDEGASLVVSTTPLWDP